MKENKGEQPIIDAFETILANSMDIHIVEMAARKALEQISSGNATVWPGIPGINMHNEKIPDGCTIGFYCNYPKCSCEHTAQPSKVQEKEIADLKNALKSRDILQEEDQQEIERLKRLVGEKDKQLEESLLLYNNQTETISKRDNEIYVLKRKVSSLDQQISSLKYSIKAGRY